MSFVHLHVHSHYSLLDGLPKIPDLIDRAKKLNMQAVALTDHGAMYGALEFYKACKEADIKPIIGMEAYLSKSSIDEIIAGEKKLERSSNHLTLIARTQTGYKNLMKLSSVGWLKGFYYKPRIDKEYLKKYSEGITILSGCLSSDISQALVAHDNDRAEELALEYQHIVGTENFFLEIQDHPELPQYRVLKSALISLSKKLSIPLAATNDVHYIDIKDKTAQDVLVCIQTNKKLESENRLSMISSNFHFATEEEMVEKFTDAPHAINTTQRIAENVDIDIPLGRWVFPGVDIPKNKTPDTYLEELSFAKLKTKFGQDEIPPLYTNRLVYELDIIKKKGYAPYFLMIADLVAAARSRAIITTTRGSAAGSLTSYAIGITTANPMDFELPFERFLNPYRPSPPDIDIDIEDARREEIIHYVEQKYGENKVAHIITFGTLLARAAVRDVGRVLNLPYSFCDKIAKMIPLGSQGFKMTLKKALEENPDLKKTYDENEDVKRIIDLASQIEGCVRHASLHAAGLVIGPRELTDFTPLHKDPNKGDIATQYDMHAVEDAGLLKMDLLGITNLSILGLSRVIIKRTRGIDIDLNAIPLNDQKTYTLLAEGKTMGVFQLAGAGMTRYLKELSPTSIFDIMAMISLYRPGPMESIPEYIARKRNPSRVVYPHPKLEPILKKSYGIITYQDDVLLTAIELAGYNWEEADKLRKAIGKKIPKEMAKQKNKFIEGCMNTSGLTPDSALRIWMLIEPFAAYGFNKAHGSSYALVAYQTAYIKANYPVEFMAAFLTCESHNMDKIAEGIAECRALNIQVLPPDINQSLGGFTVISDSSHNQHIRFGLRAIKHLGENIIESIHNEREKNGQFTSLENFLTRVTAINKKSLEALVRAGALDRFYDRAVLNHNIEAMLKFTRSHTQHDAAQQSALFETKARSLTLASPPPSYTYPILDFEKEYLNLYISAHPLDSYKKYIESLPITLIASLKKEENIENTSARIIGIVQNIKEIRTKQGDRMLFLNVEDYSGAIEVIVFPRVMKKISHEWKKDAILYIEGSLSAKDDVPKIFAQKIIEITRDTVEKFCQKYLDEHYRAEHNHFYLSLPTHISRSALESLKSFIKQHEGAVPLYLRIDGEHVKIVKTSLKISPSDEFKREILKLFPFCSF